MTKRLLTTLFLLFAAQAMAVENDCSVSSFRLDPAVVHAGERHEIVFNGICGSTDVPRAGRATVEGKTIFIDFFRSGAGAGVLTPWGARVVIGALPPGTYTVIARDVSGPLHQAIYTVGGPFAVKPSFGWHGSEVIIEGLEMVPCSQVVCTPWRVLFGSVPSDRVRVTQRGEVIAAVPAGSGRVDLTVISPRNQSFVYLGAFTYGLGEEDDYERVLFPVNFTGRGAFGSEWRTEIFVANDGPIPILTGPLFWDERPPLPGQPIPPGGKGRFHERPGDGGAFLHVPRGLESRLSYSAHVVDRSRTSTDLGTEMPVVRAKDTSNEIRLMEVPVGGLYRARLRVYDFDPTDAREVLVTVRRAGEGKVLFGGYFELNGAGRCPNAPCFASQPPFAAIDLERIEALRGAGEIDVEVQSTVDAGRIWAFVSVTNNETQHVTLYTPQHVARER